MTDGDYYMNHIRNTFEVCVHDNLRSLKLIKQFCKNENIKGLMVAVDAIKAFDSLYYN